MQKHHNIRQNLHVFINGTEIPNQDILAWETDRAIQVAKKLGIKSENQTLDELHQQLLKRKQELGHAGLKKLLAKEIKLSDVMGKVTGKLSLGRRRFCVIEILSDQGTAEQFVEWFENCGKINDEPSMLAGTPDHYIISTVDGRQEVVETNGGSPFAARFLINYEDLSSLRSKADPNYDLQLAGVAVLDNGLSLGGVRHQFRNEGAGFRAKLVVEFPLLMLPSIVSGHQWHLASEFSNWIIASIAQHLKN